MFSKVYLTVFSSLNNATLAVNLGNIFWLYSSYCMCEYNTDNLVVLMISMQGGFFFFFFFSRIKKIAVFNYCNSETFLIMILIVVANDTF